MFLKKPSVKKTIVSIDQASIYLRAIKKFGKSTLFRDLVIEKYGDPECGLLVGVGAEYGYNILDGLNSTQLENYNDFFELKKYLLTDPSAKKIKMLCFDTVDELIPLAEDYIVELSKKKSKNLDETINSAFGGYGKGRKQVVKFLKSYFKDLTTAGFCPVAIAHTKYKDIKDVGSIEEESYRQLSSDLEQDYDGAFSNIFDFVLTGTIERVIEEGKVISSERRLYFRATPNIDSGSRLAPDTVPDYMVMQGGQADAKKFIEIIEGAIRKSKIKQMSDEEYEKHKKEVTAEHEKMAEEKRKELIKKENETEKEEILNKHVEFLKSAAAKSEDILMSIASKTKEHGVKTLRELPLDVISELVEFATVKLEEELE